MKNNRKLIFADLLSKRIKILAFWIAAVMVLTGCAATDTSSNTDEGVNDMPTYITENTEDLKFMMDTYGLSEEELSGLDLAKLIGDYGFRDEEYTADEVRQIIKEQGDMYKDDGTGAIYSILDTEAEGGLKDGAEISAIGYYLNAGTSVNRYVFDLVNGKVYVDDAEAHDLKAEDAEALAGMADKYGITGWDAHTEGEEEPTTGNYAWKIVFFTGDGFAAYDGFTGDMSHLPDNYKDVSSLMTGAAKNATAK